MWASAAGPRASWASTWTGTRAARTGARRSPHCGGARAPWPLTLTVRTAHGGLHLYFRAPAGVPVVSAIARWPGIDIRGPGYRLGGYLAGPGSVVDGQPYIIERAAPIRDLPGWLAAILSRHPERLQRHLASTPRMHPGYPRRYITVD